LGDVLSDQFADLSPAEVVLLANIGNGGLDRLGDGGLPSSGQADRRVRAELVRALLLNTPGLPKMHEKGIRLSGAWITGILDLEGCRVPADIGLQDCLFDATPVLRSAVIDTLALDGSVLPGFAANRLDARGDLLFRATRIEGPVELRGARVGGDLVLDGAVLRHDHAEALVAERMSVRGNVQFRGAQMQGTLALPGARIGGDLDLVGARLSRREGEALTADAIDVSGDLILRRVVIEGAASAVSARIGGDLDASGARISAPGLVALNLNRANIAGAFFLRQEASVSGALSLVGTQMGAMVDEPASWPAPGDLLLNRCLYAAIVGGPLDADARLDWLARQDPGRWGEDFWPQPYEQLARVLSDMGHQDDKRSVLVEKERLQRRARRRRARGWPRRILLLASDLFLGLTTGYGRLPLLALIWIVALWLTGAALNGYLARIEVIRPNAPVVLRSPEWVLCGVPKGQMVHLVSVGAMREGLAAPGQSQVACYLEQPEASAYPKFSATMLSADMIFPGLGSGQKDYWSPDTRFPTGYLGKLFAYFQTLAGLGLGLLAVAGFSGIVKSD
jgi:hypothetical protein